jgi:hypothetical protein
MRVFDVEAASFDVENKAEGGEVASVAHGAICSRFSLKQRMSEWLGLGEGPSRVFRVVGFLHVSNFRRTENPRVLSNHRMFVSRPYGNPASYIIGEEAL